MGAFLRCQGCPIPAQENWGGRYAKSDRLEDVSGKRGATGATEGRMPGVMVGGDMW